MNITDNKLERSNKIFFKKIASSYDSGIILKILNRKMRKILNMANIKSGSRILDVGCGTGNLLYLLSKDKSLELYGIDLSKGMLNIAKKKLNNKADLTLGSIKDLCIYFRKNYFDYIILDDSFHHFPNQSQAIIRVKLLLKNKGKLIISDFSFGKLGNKIFHLLEPGNSGMYTLREYYLLFKKNGFSNIKQKNIGLISVYTEGIKMKGGI